MAAHVRYIYYRYCTVICCCVHAWRLSLVYRCFSQYRSHVGLAAQRATVNDDPATPDLSHDAFSPTNPHHLRSSRVHGQSREEWISKLDDARCNWMVMLQRYSSSRSDNSNNPLSKLRQSDARKTSVSNGRVPGLRVVAAADFCPECASIMKVELECTEEGEFVAEYREICSMCGNQQQTWRGSTTPNPWRIQDRRCGIDQEWWLRKVKRLGCFGLRTNTGRSLRQTVGHKHSRTQSSEMRDDVDYMLKG